MPSAGQVLANAKQYREAAVDAWSAILTDVETAERAADTTAAELAENFFNLQEAQDEAHATHTTYCKLESNRDERKKAITEFNDFNKRFIKIRTKLRPKLDQATLAELKTRSSTAGSSAGAAGGVAEDMRLAAPTSDLPKLVIPSFDGNFLNYQTWKKMFETTIAPYATLSEPRRTAMLIQALADSVRDRFDFAPDTPYASMLDLLDKYYGSSYRLAQELMAAIQAAPKVQPAKANEYQRLANLTRSIKKAVTSFQGPALGELLVMALLEAKLPEDKRHQFKLLFATASAGGNTEPSLSQFLDYTENLSINHGTQRMVTRKFGVSVLQAIDEAEEDEYNHVDYNVNAATAQPTNPLTGANTVPVGNRGRHTNRTGSSTQCVACNSPHPIYHCRSYLALRTDQRWKLVNDSALCYNCLYPGHSAASCGSSETCKMCKGTHHTTLHRKAQTNAGQQQNQPALQHAGQPPGQPGAVTFTEAARQFGMGRTAILHTGLKIMMLMTAKLLLEAKDGTFHVCRALVDPGAEASLIARRLFEKLGLAALEKIAAGFHLVGGATIEPGEVTRVKVKAKSPVTGYIFSEHCLVMDSITQACTITPQDLPDYLRGVQLADDFSLGDKIDLLLNADAFRRLLCAKRVDPPQGLDGPTALQTKIGYVLAGQLQTPAKPAHQDLVQAALGVVPSIGINRVSIDNLEKFWEVEEVPRVPEARMSDGHRQVQQHFDKTVRPGRPYQVGISFNSKKLSTLGSSYKSAKNRYLNMERRLLKTEHFAAYQAQIKDFVDSDHAERVPEAELSKPNLRYYLPHHAVLKQSSTTTKVRPVFDASHVTTSGLSLNDVINECPNNMPDLTSIMLRWKWYTAVAMADASKMYRMIALERTLWDLHRFFWRPALGEEVGEYRMKRLTWGTRPAAFLAIECMRHNAERWQAEFPAASKAIRFDAFVDDILLGAEDLTALAELCDDTIEVMKRGGFDLAKGRAGEPDVVQLIRIQPSRSRIGRDVVLAAHEVPRLLV